MKKFSFFLTVALVITLMTSCHNDTTYTINGIAKEYPDGTTIYLMMRQKPDWIPVDSAIVTKGEFVMEGQVAPGFLGFIGTDRDNCSMLVVEPGKITIDMSDGRPHGTESNERLNIYNDQMDSLDEQMHTISIEMENAVNVDSATTEQYIMRLNKLNTEEMLLLANTIQENIKSPLGVGLFCMYNSVFADEIDFLCKISQQIPEEYLNQGYVSKVLENISVIQCTAVGTHFTDLAMTTREGKDISLNDLVNTHKFVLVDFWASWCSPCRQSLPGLHKLYEEYAEKGLCIVGISLDESKEAWNAAINKYDLTWIQVSELKGWESEHAAAYGVRAIPATVLIDSTGTIIGRNLEASEVAEIIDYELSESNPQ